MFSNAFKVRKVTEFPNYKGELCLQGSFNGESVLQPSDLDEWVGEAERR